MPSMARRKTLSVGSVLIALLLAVCGCSESGSPNRLNDPAGTRDRDTGHLIKIQTETFRLRAYDIDSVHLAGSFNGWEDDLPDWELALQPDGYTWLLTRDVPAGLMQYKYVLRKGPRIEWLTDPAATEVTPDGFHASPAYWNTVRGHSFAEPAPLPAPIDRSRLVIYEISLNDFTPQGTFAGAVVGLTQMADLVDLGVNAIELMPVTAPSYNGWGYDPVLQMAPNPSFGSSSNFAALVDTAHGHGIAVILDAVINHMSGSAPLRQLDNLSGSYDFTTVESNPWGLVELNFTNPALREHIVEALSHWVDAFHVDGFRFDYVGGEPASTWVWLRDELLSRYPNLLLIAEDFSYVPNSVTIGYDAQWGGNHTDGWGGGGNNFNQVLITALTQNGFATRGQTTTVTGAWGLPYNNMWAVANVVGANDQYTGGATGDGFSDVKFLESHDENRVVWSVENSGSSGAMAVGGIAKAQLGAVVSMTSVGIPMLYNGQEIGSGEYRPQGTSTYKIPWASGDPNVRRVYRDMIGYRLNHPALQSEHTFFRWRSGNIDQVEYTLVYWRGTTSVPDLAEAVVACNFDDQAHTWGIAFPAGGPWHEYDPVAGTVTPLWVDTPMVDRTLPASTALFWYRGDGTSGVPLDP